jgi:hypothetical protein
MDALEEARAIDPTNFWAQMKYAELHYRLRALMRAEDETLKAIELAENVWQARESRAGSCRRSGVSIATARGDRALDETVDRAGAGSGPDVRGGVRRDEVVGRNCEVRLELRV